ncbi:MAG: hypothetical protein ABSG65_19625 [Bryobacteraceae bacterium]
MAGEEGDGRASARVAAASGRSALWHARAGAKRTPVYNQSMADTTQTVLTVGMPTLAVLVGILVNNARLSDLRGYIDNRFNALQQILDARFAEQKAELLRVEQVMDARLRHLEDER